MWGTLRLIRTRSFMPFVIYRCALGVGRADDPGHRLALATRPLSLSVWRRTPHHGASDSNTLKSHVR